MYERAPFRQLRRIYSSILALGRLPGIVENINMTVAAGAAQHTAAIERLATQLISTHQSTPEVAPKHDAEATKLSAFRRDLLSRIDEKMLCIDVGARWGVDSALLLLREKAKLLCFDPDAARASRLITPLMKSSMCRWRSAQTTTI